ncbi:putative electron transfer flavoprotein FixA [Raoultibacter phocaeensis]|uniref:putative electron transfer flavoprotein FixA n=1 Tax=Raoultibacter phocaeensis TaxID=2479841 RepID=UPI00111B37AB|nr:putative electron transfer flavoprotein FixA [Raoultibacter phocaeensis]
MNVVTAIKIVPDDQDIQVNADRTLNYSNARPIVSTYDLNAIEGAALAAKEQGAKLFAVTVGDSSVLDSKVAKNVLARGVDEYVAAADDAFVGLDARATAAALAAAIGKIEAYDLVVCGDGSADIYAQQVDVQLAEALNVPVVTAVSKIGFENGAIVCERTLEAEKEVVEVPLPAVVSVIPDIALPRICGMKDILAAGKKPVTSYAAADLGVDPVHAIEAANVLAPEPTPRKRELFDASDEADVDKFVAAILESIR